MNSEHAPSVSYRTHDSTLSPWVEWPQTYVEIDTPRSTRRTPYLFPDAGVCVLSWLASLQEKSVSLRGETFSLVNGRLFILGQKETTCFRLPLTPEESERARILWARIADEDEREAKRYEEGATL